MKIPHCRLETFKQSFFPRIASLWNDLPLYIQFSKSTEEFKRHFKPEQTERILLYYYGERWPAVHHARMRIGCSKLNDHLCNNLHVIDYSNCQCGAEVESTKHYFLVCLIYVNERNRLMHTILNQFDIEITVDVLLYGDPLLSLQQNKRVFEAVHKFILDSHRFEE